MKFYFLTDESEKSLAPFFSDRVLGAAGDGDAVPALLVLADLELDLGAGGHRLPVRVRGRLAPAIFFLVAAATLIV